MADNNLSALIISGLPTEEELQKAWETISGQYIERIGSNEYKMFLAIYKEISILKITLDQVNFIAARENKEKGIPPGVLRLYYVEELAMELNKLVGANFKFNNNDPQSYHADLDRSINRSKSIKIQLDLKLLSFEAIEKKNIASGKEKPSREYFTSVMVTLSDFAKYQLPDTIKMGEYCERLKRFNKACEQSKKK